MVETLVQDDMYRVMRALQTDAAVIPSSAYNSNSCVHLYRNNNNNNKNVTLFFVLLICFVLPIGFVLPIRFRPPITVMSADIFCLDWFRPPIGYVRR